jgi:hypothetical protein
VSSLPTAVTASTGIPYLWLSSTSLVMLCTDAAQRVFFPDAAHHDLSHAGPCRMIHHRPQILTGLDVRVGPGTVGRWQPLACTNDMSSLRAHRGDSMRWPVHHRLGVGEPRALSGWEIVAARSRMI